MALTNAERCRRYQAKRAQCVNTLIEQIQALAERVNTLQKSVNTLIEENQLLRESVNRLAARVNTVSTPPTVTLPSTSESKPPLCPPMGDSPPLTLGGYDHETIPQASKNGSGRRRATRLPTDWRPCEEDRQFCSAAGLDPDRIAEEFRDYWHSKPGANGTKLDWCATWRNWCRKAAEYRGGDGHRKPRGDQQRRSPLTEALHMLLGEGDSDGRSLYDISRSPMGG